MINQIGAIVLAAGQGKRMGAINRNKVVFTLKGKPMIAHTIQLLKNLAIDDIIVVIGFAKESVKNVLKESVVYAEQEIQKGTADAVRIGVQKLNSEIAHVLVLNGDDSAFYKKETVEKLICKHLETNAQATFLTTIRTDIEGIGRIVRTNGGKLVKIVEEKDATVKEKKINEVNVGCYMFQVSFLKSYVPRLGKSEVTGEFYLTSIIDMALQDGLLIETVVEPDLIWYGINTQNDLEKAENFLI